MDIDAVKPYKESDATKKQQVIDMFDNISNTYDFLDHLLSAGLDVWWRHKVIKHLKQLRHGTILDIATGTGPLAIKAAKLNPKQIIGVDISSNMIALGQQKISRLNLQNTISLEVGDCEALRFNDNFFDVTMAGFGVRNFENLKKGLAEMHRVTKKGGSIIILEFSKPKKFPIKQLYWLYCRYIIPVIGGIIARDKPAYAYLPESIQSAPDGKDFEQLLLDVGYTNVHAQLLSGGVATLYSATKQD